VNNPGLLELTRGDITMISDFLQDYVINKLNGYFLNLYGTGHLRLAWIAERANDLVVFMLVCMRLIPARRRLKKKVNAY